MPDEYTTFGPMETTTIIRPLRIRTTIHPTLSSTNQWMHAHRHLFSTPTLCIALTQTNGVGQRGNSWLSLAGDATFSLYLPEIYLPASRFFILSQIASLATAQWLQQHHLQPTIKWPNDILINGKKIAGILIETFAAKRYIRSAIIGIGINLAHRTPKHMQIPYPITTLSNESRTPPSPTACAQSVAQRILALHLAPPFRTMHRIPHSYQQLLYLRNQSAPFCDANGHFHGQITHVTPDGRLCILDSHETERRYAFKEVQFIR